MEEGLLKQNVKPDAEFQLEARPYKIFLHLCEVPSDEKIGLSKCGVLTSINIIV